MATTPNSIITAQTPNTGVKNVVLSTAMTNTKAWDGTEAAGTAMALVYTAGANGSRVDKLIVRPSGTNGAAPSGASSATVLHVFINNGSGANTTASNNSFFGQLTVASFTPSATAALTGYEYPINVVLQAGEKVYVGLTTAVGGTNDAIAVSCFGADL